MWNDLNFDRNHNFDQLQYEHVLYLNYLIATKIEEYYKEKEKYFYLIEQK